MLGQLCYSIIEAGYIRLDARGCMVKAPHLASQVALIAALVTATAPVLVLIWLLQGGCSYRLLVQLTPTHTDAGPA